MKTFWLIAVLLFFGWWGVGLAQTTQEVKGWAWTPNMGWLKFDSGSNGVKFNPTTGSLTGFAWSPYIGWVSFNPFGKAGPKVESNNAVSGWIRACSAAANPSTCSGGTNPTAGGWDGWVKLSGAWSNGVARAGNALTGFAWGSDVIGWLKFNATISDLVCPSGQEEWGGSCVPTCPSGQTRNSSGNCVTGVTCGAPGLPACPPVDGGGGGGGGPGDPCPGGDCIPGGGGVGKLEILSGEFMTIRNQPLGSAAISTASRIKNTGTAYVQACILSIKSKTNPSYSLTTADPGVQCALKVGDNPFTVSDFRACPNPGGSGVQLKTTATGDGEVARLAVKISRPLQAVATNNPYEVEVGDCVNPSVQKAKPVLDYQVGSFDPL